MTPDTCPHCGAPHLSDKLHRIQWECLSQANRVHLRSPWAVSQSRQCARYVRTRISQLKRMAHTAWLRKDYPRSAPISFCRRGQYDRFASACLREIDRLRGRA